MIKPRKWIDGLIIITIISYVFFANTMTFVIGFPIKISDILSLILLPILLMANYYQKMVDKKSITRYLTIWAIFASLLSIVTTFVYQFDFMDAINGISYSFRLFLVIATAHQIWIYMKHAKMNQLKTLKIINYAYLCVCLLGFVQYFVYPVVRDWYQVFWNLGVYWIPDPHLSRIVSTYFDPNFLASCLLIGIVINMILYQKDNKYRYWFYMIIYISAILLTKSRSGMIGLIVILGFYIMQSINWKKIKNYHFIGIFLFILISFYMIFLSNITVFVRIRTFMTDESALARFESWYEGLKMVSDNIFGLGYNMIGAYKIKNGSFESIATDYGNDSSLIVVAITSGILGFIIFSCFLIRYLLNPNINKHMKSLLIASLIISNFNNLLFYTLWLFPFLLVTNMTTNSSNVLVQEVPNERKDTLYQSYITKD